MLPPISIDRRGFKGEGDRRTPPKLAAADYVNIVMSNLTLTLSPRPPRWILGRGGKEWATEHVEAACSKRGKQVNTILLETLTTAEMVKAFNEWEAQKTNKKAVLSPGTARCSSCSLRFKVHRHSLQVYKSSQAPKARFQSYGHTGAK